MPSVFSEPANFRSQHQHAAVSGAGPHPSLHHWQFRCNQSAGSSCCTPTARRAGRAGLTLGGKFVRILRGGATLRRCQCAAALVDQRAPGTRSLDRAGKTGSARPCQSVGFLCALLTELESELEPQSSPRLPVRERLRHHRDGLAPAASGGPFNSSCLRRARGCLAIIAA